MAGSPGGNRGVVDRCSSGGCQGERVQEEAREWGRWITGDFDAFVGAPLEPCSGAEGRFECKSKVRLSADPEDFTEIAKGKNNYAPRILRIRS